MEWITNLLQHYPELAIFITLALGFWIGKFPAGLCPARHRQDRHNRYKRTVKVRLFLDVPLRCRI